MRTGTLSKKDLCNIIDAGRIISLSGFEKRHVGSASVDLTVSNNEAYQLTNFFTPSGRRKETVHQLLSSWKAKEFGCGEIMYPGCQYLVKATIDIDIPPGMYAYCNAKSTSGRNMLLCRVVADAVEGYDTLGRKGEGLTSRVWMLLEPLVFPVILTDKECYLQVRFFDGDRRFSDEDLHSELQLHDFLLRQDGGRYKQGELSLRSGDGTVFTTFYAKAGKLIGFKARKDAPPLDLTKRDLCPREYFEPVYAEIDPSDSTGGLYSPQPLEYYLFSTNETTNIPTHLSSELIPMHPRLGLFFTHFAGFFDPGFCGVPTLEYMTPIATTLRHRNAIACFKYEYMRSETESYAVVGNYAGQRRTTLPKQFTMPEEWKFAME